MARSKTNSLTKGYSGTFADQLVFKNYGGVMVLSKKPVFTKPWSEKQKANRKKFAAAAKAAARLAKDPAIQRKYKKKLKPCQNVINLLVRERLKEDKNTKYNTHEITP